MFTDDPFNHGARARMLARMLTDRARQGLVQAEEEARRQGHEYVGTEHILLALVADPDENMATLFRTLSIDPEHVRVCVMDLLRRGSPSAGPDRLPYTARAKQVLTHALWEAEDLRHAVVDSEHLLLGLARDSGGVAAEILRNVGLSVQEIREGAKYRAAGDVRPPIAPE